MNKCIKILTLSFAAPLFCAITAQGSAAEPHVLNTTVPEAELHFSICEPSPERLFEKLGVSPQKNKQRKVSYADTAQQEYWRTGLTIRTRQVVGKKPKTEATVKVKVASISEIESEWFQKSDFKCEYDRYGAALSLSCSLTEETNQKSVPELSDDQIRFAKAHGHRNFDTKILSTYGPAQDTAWKDISVSVGSSALSIDVQRYSFPQGDQILEVSTRAAKGDADEVYAALKKKLAYSKVELCNTQASKTRQFFERFSPQFD
jgi:hypothetical protein